MELDLVSLAYSFAVGVGAFFNPCGFIMLPSYVAHYLSADEAETSALGQRMARGFSVGSVVGVGFLVVFLTFGFALSLVGSVLVTVVPWLAMVVAVVLIVLGVGMLFGKTWALPWRPDQWLMRSKWVSANAESDTTNYRFYFVYGVMYALASVSCTFPLFLAVVAQSFSLSALNGTVHFLAYALGMLLMMLALSLLTAVSKSLVQHWMTPLLRWMPRVSGIVLIAAGGYLIIYNISAGLL